MKICALAADVRRHPDIQVCIHRDRVGTHRDADKGGFVWGSSPCQSGATTTRVDFLKRPPFILLSFPFQTLSVGVGVLLARATMWMQMGFRGSNVRQ